MGHDPGGFRAWWRLLTGSDHTLENTHLMRGRSFQSASVDQCFIADETREQLPVPSQVGKTRVGGIDFNKPRMRWVAEAVMALSPSPGGFTASELAQQVRTVSRQSESRYGARRAAYDLKKFRGKQIVCRIEKRRRYEPIPRGLRAMAAFIVLRDRAIKPLLAAAQETWPTHAAQNPTALDTHFHTIHTAM
jgi:hypothetical protein